MKTAHSFVAIGILLSGWMPSTEAQIRDNESSATALAVQCAVSSGYSVQDYEDYCRRLAKTIGMLSSAQQTRIFGYLPQPGGSAVEGGTNPTEGTTNGTVSGSPTDHEGAPGTGPTAETGPIDPGVLIGLIRQLNNTIDGTTNASAPVVAGTTGVELTPGSVKKLTRSLENAGGMSSWDALLSWFGQAEAAYQNGSLSSFLRDNQQ